jgi:chromosome segregation ATPase
LENKILELQKQVQTLKGNKKWELAGIDGILKEVFSNTMEILEKGLYAAEGRNESLKRQLTAQSVKIEELNKQLEKVNEELKKLTLSYVDREHQIEGLQLEVDSLEPV